MEIENLNDGDQKSQWRSNLNYRHTAVLAKFMYHEKRQGGRALAAIYKPAPRSQPSRRSASTAVKHSDILRLLTSDLIAMRGGASLRAPLHICITPVRAVLGTAIGSTIDEAVAQGESVDRGGCERTIRVPTPERRVVIARTGLAPATQTNPR